MAKQDLTLKTLSPPSAASRGGTREDDVAKQDLTLKAHMKMWVIFAVLTGISSVLALFAGRVWGHSELIRAEVAGLRSDIAYIEIQIERVKRGECADQEELEAVLRAKVSDLNLLLEHVSASTD